MAFPRQRASTNLSIALFACVIFVNEFSLLACSKKVSPLHITLNSVLGNGHLPLDLVHPTSLGHVLPELDGIENVTTCLRHVADWSIGIIEGKDWALKMIDSTSKIPSGILSGNVIHLGDFEECLSITSEQTESDLVPQYCLTRLVLLFHNQTENRFYQYVLGGETSVTLAICIPASCNRQWIQEAVNATVSRVPLQRGNLRLNYVIDQTDCYLKKQPLSFGLLEWLIIVVIFTVIVVVCVSTLVDKDPAAETDGRRNTAPSRELEALSAFSAKSNLYRLMKEDDPDECFGFLHGIKSVSMIWILLAQRFQFLGMQPVENIFELVGVIKNWSTMIILSAPLSIDTFLVIAGFLNSYLTLLFSKQTERPAFIRYVSKYFRLTPPLCAMIGLTIVWLKYAEYGPLWNRVVEPEVEHCRQYWYTSLLYINNYYNPNSICLSQSWYLSVYMQLYILSPLVLYPLIAWPVLGGLMLSVLSVASVIVPYYVAFKNEFKTPIPFSREWHELNAEIRLNFIPTHVRFSSYIVGLSVGFAVYYFRVKRDNFRISKGVAAIGWCLSTVGALCSLFGGYWLYQFGSSYVKLYSSLYIALYRTVWSLAVGWIIFYLACSKVGFAAKALSSKIFVIFSRLTYCIFLTHVAVLLYQFGSTKAAIYFTKFDQVHRVFGDLVLNLFFALLLHITFEAPFLRLTQRYKMGRTKIPANEC